MEVFVLYVVLNTGAAFNVGILETQDQCLQAVEYVMENVDDVIEDRSIVEAGCYPVYVDENGNIER